MDRKHIRKNGKDYCIQIMQINGEVHDELVDKPINLDNISKGGFRFISDINFELEDRIQVILKFPDNTIKDVLGRICYCENGEAGDEGNKDAAKAYGFSILVGFYELNT